MQHVSGARHVRVSLCAAGDFAVEHAKPGDNIEHTSVGLVADDRYRNAARVWALVDGYLQGAPLDKTMLPVS
jgi:hypothetical protein